MATENHVPAAADRNGGGPVVLVTGAAGGIGAATVARFRRQGARVVAADRRLEDALWGGTASVRLDVSRGEDWAMAVARIAEWFGRLDVLVNNAGVGWIDGVRTLSLDHWEHSIAVNQTGVLLGMHHAAATMVAGGGGAIVNVGSIYALKGSPSAISYAATKGALRQMTRSAAIELAPDGIRVNAVHPGFVDTPMIRGGGHRVREAVVAATPMRRVARPEEIAAAITFLASPDASFITGADLVVDGGLMAG
ncbi:MAG: hypothetical protein JWM31_3234 [Solirubrobacterales bacterium]|nr:hypothetical protein [Solirubrobacterales bacterium]